MGKRERNRGKDGEREVARITREELGTDARRGQQYAGGPDSPDVIGVPGFHLEVKRVEALRLNEAISQSENDAADDEVPTVVFRRDRQPWRIILPYRDFLRLYKKANPLIGYHVE